MKRKNLIAKKQVKNKILLKKFEKILVKNLDKEDFALGVSGGPDSLCLAYFCKLYSLKFKNKMHVLVVNHNIK